MGCDIHVYFEVRFDAGQPKDDSFDLLDLPEPPKGWQSAFPWRCEFGKYWEYLGSTVERNGFNFHFHVGEDRNYEFFGLLTGGVVRRESQYPAVATSGLPRDGSPEVCRHYDERNCHSPHHVQGSDLVSYFEKHEETRKIAKAFLQEVLPVLEGLVAGKIGSWRIPTEDVRIVFWFD